MVLRCRFVINMFINRFRIYIRQCALVASCFNPLPLPVCFRLDLLRWDSIAIARLFLPYLSTSVRTVTINSWKWTPHTNCLEIPRIRVQINVQILVARFSDSQTSSLLRKKTICSHSSLCTESAVALRPTNLSWIALLIGNALLTAFAINRMRGGSRDTNILVLFNFLFKWIYEKITITSSFPSVLSKPNVRF